MPPTSSGPGIWLDVLEQVTNGLTDFTLVTNCTNYGFLGGYFHDVNSPPTNHFYRTISGGALTGRAPGTRELTWLTNGVDGNNQCYFQSNFGTAAFRLNSKDYDHAPGAIQTGTTGPTGPGAGYLYCQYISGTVYFDWGQPSLANRISVSAPASFNNTWVNLVYVKSNALMQIWTNGALWTQSTGHSGESLFPTNNYAGPLNFLNGLTTTNFLTKRILLWREVLTPTEIANLDTWMSAMP